MITPLRLAAYATVLVPAALMANSLSHPKGLVTFEADVGQPAIRGSARYDEFTQTYALTAGGTNMWLERDEFHLLARPLSGDFILRTRIEFLGPGVDPHCKGGLIIRPDTDPSAPYVDAAAHAGDGLTSLQFRRTAGAETEQIVLPVTHADVLQLERRGTTYIFSAARYGEPFVSAELPDLQLPDEVLAGLFLCSHRADVEERALFRDVRIVRPPKAGYVPYRDYIGAHLEVLNVFTGRLELLHTSPEQFEAPNWTPDGGSLIYNVSGPGPNKGRLFRFDLATREISPIETGFANRNNNDHVLSFDGRLLGISHHSADHNGQSMVYTLPATGGTPALITQRAPSYLHGWSPDAQWLVYTGGRDNKYDIYKIPAAGGEEVRLTDSPGLSDGPEFAPDGQTIYYNSTRSGRMQLWRMKPDGSDQEQVTDDEFNNWFPHVSPDGKWIAFLSYLPDVPAAEHPYYQQVYLRLMPVSGGPARVIAYVYGGQGTINVPSWSPDSRRIAFVSNTRMD